MNKVTIRPQPGPQEQFLKSPSDIAIYGGAAGGGKSWALLVEPLRHSHIKDFNAVFFRRSTVQIKNVGGLWDESKLIYTDVGAVAKENPTAKWTFPSGATVVFSHLEHDKTVHGWQGSAIALLCCTAETNVIMADGSMKNVGDISVGDMVKTHQGARMVTKVGLPKVEPCVRLTTFDGLGNEVGSQIQAESHYFLTFDSWQTFCDHSGRRVVEPIEHHSSGICEEQRHKKPLLIPAPLYIQQNYQEPKQESLQSERDHQYSQETCACMGKQDQDNYSELFQCDSQEPLLRLSSHHLPVHPLPFDIQEARTSFHISSLREVSCETALSSVEGSICDCLFCIRQYDESKYLLQDSDQYHVRQQDGVERQSQKRLTYNGQDRVQKYIHHKLSYDHPYTGEERISELELVSGSCSMVPVGKHEVIHFTVEGENHYITECGLTSQNCFDELCHFSEKQFWYMLSRNRSLCGVKPYVRATCNPDADSWVKEFIQWWIDPKTGLSISERSGVIRWMIRTGDSILWADRPDELAQYTMTNEDGQEVPIPPKSVTFIHSALTDNKILMKENPEYMANLLALPTVERERLLGGNWNIRPSAGLFFNRNWVEIVDELPSKGIQWVRGWDLAATIKTETNNPDWTCGTLVGRGRDGTFYVADHVFDRLSPNGVERLIRNTASRDGKSVRISIPQDPAQSGKSQALGFTKMLAGYRIITSRESGPKETRFSGFSAQAEGGNVIVKRGKWNSRWFRELEGFPEAQHDDDVDSTSRAFNELLEGSNYSIRGMI